MWNASLQRRKKEQEWKVLHFPEQLFNPFSKALFSLVYYWLVISKILFFPIFWTTSVLYVGPLICLFSLLVKSVLGFKARVDRPLVCFVDAHHKILLRFTSGVTLADLFVVSMTAKPF